jgi:UDP-N-acetylglucosamine acyltransferase
MEWAGRDPRSVLIGEVALGEPCRIDAFAVLEGPLVAGPRLFVATGAAVGGPAQHRAGGVGSLRIGDGVTIREHATVHRGSPAGGGVTVLGDDVLVMAYAHVGHDATLGAGVTVANGAQVGGHAEIGARAVLGARCAVHQHVRIGRGAMIAAGAMVAGDVPPWAMAAGDRARIAGANGVGLRAAGFARSEAAVRAALRAIVGGRGAVPGAEAGSPVADIVSWASQRARRPLCAPGWR